jgi:hypothetical protein
MATAKMRSEDEVAVPRLPPIERPKTTEDPYLKSKMMTFRLAKRRQEMLRKIMLVMKSYSMPSTSE